MLITNILVSSIFLASVQSLAVGKTRRGSVTHTTTCSLVEISPAPRALHCGAYGSLIPRRMAPLDLVPVDNVLDCIASCKANGDCISVAYDEAQGACQHYAASLVDMGLRTFGAAGPTMWNKHCFKEICVSVEVPSNSSATTSTALSLTTIPASNLSAAASTNVTATSASMTSSLLTTASPIIVSTIASINTTAILDSTVSSTLPTSSAFSGAAYINTTASSATVALALPLTSPAVNMSTITSINTTATSSSIVSPSLTISPAKNLSSTAYVNATIISATTSTLDSAFCASFAAMETATITITQTLTPANVTATSTSFAIGPSVTVMATEVDTSLVEVTTILTSTPVVTMTAIVTQTSTYSCFTGATTLTTTIISASPLPLGKRQISTDLTSLVELDSITIAAPVLPSVGGDASTTGSGSGTSLAPFPNSTLPSACATMMPSHTTTEVVTITLLPNNVASTIFNVTTPTTTITTTSISTTITTTTSLSLAAPSTTTITNTLILPTPSGISTGLNYYIYPSTLNYNLATPGFNATTFNSPSYTTTGFLTTIDALQTLNYGSSSSTMCGLPGTTALDCGDVVFVMQGYFYAAAGAGEYTISTGSNIDNALYFWAGEDAYADYTNSNWAYAAVRAGSGPYTGGSVTLTLQEYEMVPVTVMWVNGGGIGAAFLSVVMPNGQVDVNGFWLPADDGGACPGLVSPFAP